MAKIMDKENYVTGNFYRAFFANQACEQKAYVDVVYLGDDKFVGTTVFAGKAGVSGEDTCQKFVKKLEADTVADNEVKIYCTKCFDEILSLSDHMSNCSRLSDRQVEWLTGTLKKREAERMPSRFDRNFVFGKVYTLRRVGTNVNEILGESLSVRPASGSAIIECTGVYIGDDKFVIVSMGDEYTVEKYAPDLHVADDAYTRFYIQQTFHVPHVIVKRPNIGIIYETEVELAGLVNGFDCVLSTEQMNMVRGLVRIQEGADELVKRG